ncbi:MAG TPA: hypothetical protein VK168_03715 [Saprospiraceae bacterium]|nr:hypothetical protein [Saprospiraceae bacterium]
MPERICVQAFFCLAECAELCSKLHPTMIRFGLLVPMILLCAYSAAAQMESTMYQVFEIDSAQTVQFEITGEYQVSEWAGNSILVETTVQLWDANKEILAHLIKEGRYDLATDSTSDPHPRQVRIYTKYIDRKPLKRRDGQKCLEIAVTKIFVPDTFYISEDRQRLTRKGGK